MKIRIPFRLRPEFQNILRLAWPAVLEEALATVVIYADAAMVGALGPDASAAVGLTGTVNWLILTVLRAFGAGVLAVCAQADGAGDEPLLKKAAQQALYLVATCGLVLSVACLAVSPHIAGWLNGAPEIRADAGAYFAIVSLPMLLRASQLILSSVLRGVSDMKTPMRIGLMTNALNIVLNFFLIYPVRTVGSVTVWGAGLGVRGAAWATAVSIAAGGLLTLYKYLMHPRFAFRTTGFRFDAGVMRRCLAVGLPMAFERAVVFTGHIVYASTVARLGVIPFAAHTIALQAEEAFYIPGFGLQSAAATLAGNAVGERNGKKLDRVAKNVSLLASGVMLVCGLVLVLVAPGLMRLFTPDETVVALGASVLRIVALSEPVYGMLIILEGVFNGMGETRAPMVYGTLTMWGIRVLGTVLCIGVFGFGLKAAWVCMVLDNVVRAVLLLARYLGGKWRPRILGTNG
ncbi:MAG: MATE family efflux transporter [Clostridia bacterium]|nr:MATE family efflux transporter [Clostridia bacterium]